MVSSPSMIAPGRGPLWTVTSAGRGAGCGAWTEAGCPTAGGGHAGSTGAVAGCGRWGSPAPSATASSGTGVAGSTRNGAAAGSAAVLPTGMVVVTSGSAVGSGNCWGAGVSSWVMSVVSGAFVRWSSVLWFVGSGGPALMTLSQPS